MILPGDILWEQYRVQRVESDQTARAWLTRLSTPFSKPSVKESPGPVLLMGLDEPSGDPLNEFFALVWHSYGAANRDGDAVDLGVLGSVEFHGEPGSFNAGAAVIALPARESLLESLPPAGDVAPGSALGLLSALCESVSNYVFSAVSRGTQAEAFHAGLAKLLHPGAIGIYQRGGVATLGLCLPSPRENATSFAPPGWTHYCAPEVLRGESCGEAALVYGVGQLGRAMLLGRLKSSANGVWWQFAQDIVGRRDASKEFVGDPGAEKVPAELRMILAKCLKPRASGRFATLAKLASALKKLREFEWARSNVGAPVNELAAIPKEALPAGMTVINAGAYLAGEKKLSRTLRTFAIDLRPVTEKEYKQFLKATQGAPRAGGPGTRSIKFDDHPVVNASWKEAEKFAEHHGKRLPTIHEWEKAARGSDGRKFPYGEAFLPGTGKLRATTAAAPGPSPAPAAGKEVARTTAPAGSFPLGASPYGVLDMAGNVLEWTSTGRRQGQRMFRAIKGACFLDGSIELSRCASMQYKSPDAAENCIGFRCVKDLD